MHRVTIEDVRRNYFHDSSAPAKTRAVVQRIEDIFNKDLKESSEKDPFSVFLNTLFVRFRSARIFDKKSVGQLHTSDCLPAVFAHITSTIFNNNTIIQEVSPTETAMEAEVIDWIKLHIARYTTDRSSGALVSNGTLANLTALMVARERLIEEGKWDLSTPAVILTTEMGHYSLKKAAHLLAPGKMIIVDPVKILPNYKMDLNDLAKKISDHQKANTPIMAVVAIAGQTETGIVDDLQKIAAVCAKHDIFLHIDGAYGAPFRLSRRASLFDGIEQGNSLTIDPHKYMYTPYNVGCVLFRDIEDHALLCSSNEDGKEYMFKEGAKSCLGGRRIEGSMGGQGAASTWAVIETLGVEGFKALLDYCLDLTDYAYEKIMSTSIFEPAFKPELNTVCFYLKTGFETLTPPQQSSQIDRICRKLEATKGYYLRSTTIPVYDKLRNEFVEKGVFRLVFTHPSTTVQNIDEIFTSLEELIEEEYMKLSTI
jgi:glutamate/tyrosine decarboxylase-like PLP-dependent enzyme